MDFIVSNVAFLFGFKSLDETISFLFRSAFWGCIAMLAYSVWRSERAMQGAQDIVECIAAPADVVAQASATIDDLKPVVNSNTTVATAAG